MNKFIHIDSVDGIYRTMAVSFPRSGHHWMQRMLSGYFGERLHYCEYYMQPELRYPNPGTNYQKQHDFELSLDVEAYRYFVQVRDPEEAIRSWYKLEMEKQPLPGTFEDFRNGKSVYYINFMAKWTCGDWSNRVPRHILYYRDLRIDTINQVAEVIRFITGGREELDWDRLREIVINQWKYTYASPVQ